jgi:predicted lipid-binding transport protein (Tim44 family)
MRLGRCARSEVLRQLRERDRAMKRPAAFGAVMAGGALGAGAAFGRAGGGGHSGGGGGSGGGHSSSGGHSFSTGSGGGSLDSAVAFLVIGLLIFFFIRRLRRNLETPSMGAPPTAQAAVAAIGAALGQQAMMRRAGAAPALMGAPAANLRATVDQIRARDPGFELELFLQRAEMIFFLVKRGVQQNDAAAVRPYLSDPMFAALSAIIAQAKTRHQHALLESLNVRAVHVESAACDDGGQRIEIHFDLVYRAKLLNDANQVLSDEGTDHRHGEHWTFTRGANARTPVNGGVVAACCPACGAELRLNLDGTCTHCRASVTNGAVDWVVAEVRNAPFIGYAADSSLAVAAASVEQGVANLHASDPGFEMDAFRGRVKVAFRALQDAWCGQNLDAGRAFLSPGAYFTWRAQLETMAAEGRRNVMEQLIVQRIDPVVIVHGRVFDDITVRISASAADFEVDAGNKIVFGDRTVRSFTEDWTFQRSVGVATTQKPGTLENTCPSCGAPVALNQIGECRFCKAAVTSGKFDWVVSRIEQDEVPAAGGSSQRSAGEDIALQVGGAIVGGLLSSLLSNASRNSDDWR